MALFLENRNNSVITPTINTYLPKIPSYKFITMLPQLVPHITDSNCDKFSQEIEQILEKCAKEHPHHTLPLILSLANANKDREFSKEVTKTSQNDGRISAALKLIEKLKKVRNMSQMIDRLQQLCVALIDLAYHKDGGGRKKKFQIPDNHKIRKIEHFDDVLLPTYHLKIHPGGNYTNIVGELKTFYYY